MVGQTLPPAFESPNAAVTGSDRVSYQHLLTTSRAQQNRETWDAKKRMSTSRTRIKTT